MPFIAREQNRKTIAFSQPLLQSHKDHIVDAMEASLRLAEQGDESFGHSDITAMVLVDLLLARGRKLADTGSFGKLDDVRSMHRAVGITGRHYSRFGDALIAILTDVLGPRLPREAAAAWCDAFWAIIREMTADAVEA